MSSNYLIHTCSAIFAFLLLVGCNNNEPPPKQHVKLQLEWKKGSEHAFLYYGIAKGIFSQEGIELEVVPGSGSTSAANMVDAKTVTFALCAGETALIARAAESPRRIRNIAVFFYNTPTAIFSVRSNLALNVLEDLYGKRLGIIKGSSAYMNYVALAKMQHLDRSRITEVPITGDIKELVSGNAQIDAMVQFAYQQPLLLQLAGYDISIINLSSFEFSAYGQGLIVHSDTVEKEPDLVRRCVRAVQKSYVATLKHPEEALEVFNQLSPELDTKFSKNKLLWVNAFVERGAIAGKPFGFQRPEIWKATKDYLESEGMLSRSVNLQEFWSNDFLDPSIEWIDSKLRK